MKLLADENIPASVVMALKEEGYDIRWIRIESPGISDIEVMRYAHEEQRILLTYDKDFGKLALKDPHYPSSGIILVTARMMNRLPVASATISLSLSRYWNHRHPEILPLDDPAASIKNAVPEMVRLPAGSRARSSPVHGCARNVLSCRWIHPLRIDGERAITAIFVRGSFAG